MSLHLFLYVQYTVELNKCLLNAWMSVPEVKEMVATSPHALSHGNLPRRCTIRAHCVALGITIHSKLSLPGSHEGTLCGIVLHAFIVLLLPPQGGDTHPNRSVLYLLWLWYPKCWKVRNLMGGPEKAPEGLGSQCSMRDDFSWERVTHFKLSPVNL